MNRIVYSALTWLLLPLAALHLLLRALKQPEYLQHWGERFGLVRTRHALPVIWLHAVSVGETRAAEPLLAALRLRYPQHQVVITHMTPTGRATSQALLANAVDIRYLPYDTPWAAQQFIDDLRPVLGLIIETELWPNLISACHRRQVPLLLINARMSDKSARRYARFSYLSTQVLRQLTAISAVGADDAARLRQLGASDVEVFGNLKFDCPPPQEQLQLAKKFRGRCQGRPVFLAASTRDGEEALLLDAWLRAANKNLINTTLLVIVPRHPQRFNAVADLIKQRALTMQRRSQENIEHDVGISPTTQVWLGDSMGEMFAWYASADVAFIGGSLLAYGSQNLIEACAVGTPVLIGRSDYNFADVAHAAITAGAALRINDADDLVASALALLQDEKRRHSMGTVGQQLAMQHAGATTRNMGLIARFLP